MIDFSPNEFLVTISAPKLLKPSKHLPKDVSPWNLLLPQKLNELVDIPEPVSLVLLNHSSMVVDELISLGTDHPFPLIVGVQVSTIDAVIEHVLVFFE